MTVQELIDKLHDIEDKAATVCIDHPMGGFYRAQDEIEEYPHVIVLSMKRDGHY